MSMRGSIVAVLALMISLASAVIASGDEGDYGGGISYTNSGDVEVAIETKETSESRAAGAVNHSRVCRSQGQVIPCQGEFGTWNSSRGCYVRVGQELTAEDPFEGHTTGFRMVCTFGGGFGRTGYMFWQPDTVLTPPPPDPALLARRAVDRMQLQAVTIGTFPASSRATRDLGYVGWNAWMWVASPSETTWGPIAATASLDGYSVRAEAIVDRVVWDMGNGDTVTCQQGTPWKSIYTRNEPSPDCGYVYEKDGEYTITATSYWVVQWSGIGQTGTINVERSASTPLRIAEIQVLNVPPKGR